MLKLNLKGIYTASTTTNRDKDQDHAIQNQERMQFSSRHHILTYHFPWKK